jgi:hypothetical protein
MNHAKGMSGGYGKASLMPTVLGPKSKQEQQQDQQQYL